MRLVFNNFVLDCEQRVLWSGSEIVPLSPKGFETLQLLVVNHGRIVKKHEFMQALWPDSFVEESNLTQNIFVLRKVLGTASDGRSYIETVPKRGYRFVGAVCAKDPTPGPNQARSFDAPEIVASSGGGFRDRRRE